MAQILCQELPDVPSPLALVLSNGTAFTNAITTISRYPRNLDLNLDMIQNRMMPAIAGLRPMVDMIETATGIITCLTAIGGAISSTPPNPSDLAKVSTCLGDLLAVFQKLLEANPLYWVPILIIKFLDAVIFAIDDAIFQIQEIQAEVNRILALFNIAANFDQQYAEGLLSCSQKNAENELLTVGEALQGLGAAFALINAFAGIIGKTFCVALPDAFSLEAIDSLIELLRGVQGLILETRKLFSVPDIMLDLFAAAQGAGGCTPNVTIDKLGLNTPPTIQSF